MQPFGQKYHIKEKEHKNLRPFSLLDVVMIPLTILAAVLLLLSYAAPSINPNTMWAFALLGLIAPVLYISNLMLLLYWLIRWKGFFFVPLIALIFGIGNLTLFFRPVLSKSYHEQQSKSSFNVMSYNVIGFINPLNDRGESCMEETLGFAVSQSPDILCMQEYQTTHKITQRAISRILKDMPHKRIHYKKMNRDSIGWGVATYSRYPIIRSGTIDFEQSTNSIIWCDVVLHKDTIRVFNNHLQTTSINQEEKEFITTQQIVESNNEEKSEKFRSITRKLRDNYKKRALQADTLASAIAQTRYPVIVCGDFNDTPLSYCYKTIRGDDLKDAFKEKGRGITSTYRGLFNLFRIDYILYSSVFEASNYSSPQLDKSDHNPVIVTLRLTK